MRLFLIWHLAVVRIDTYCFRRIFSFALLRPFFLFLAHAPSSFARQCWPRISFVHYFISSNAEAASRPHCINVCFSPHSSAACNYYCFMLHYRYSLKAIHYALCVCVCLFLITARTREWRDGWENRRRYRTWAKPIPQQLPRPKTKSEEWWMKREHIRETVRRTIEWMNEVNERGKGCQMD